MDTYEAERQLYYVLLIAIPVAFYLVSKHLMKSVRPKQSASRNYDFSLAAVLYGITLIVYLTSKEIWGINLKLVNATLLWHIPLAAVGLLIGIAAFVNSRMQPVR